MSVSNIDKDHSDNLFLSLNRGKNIDSNTVEIIKSNHSNYAQLKLLYVQMKQLESHAKEIIENAEKQNELHQIKKNFRLVSGSKYYLYEKNGEKFFSLISKEEWGILKNNNENNEKNKIVFKGSYYYDYDKQFVLL